MINSKNKRGKKVQGLSSVNKKTQKFDINSSKKETILSGKEAKNVELVQEKIKKQDSLSPKEQKQSSFPELESHRELESSRPFEEKKEEVSSHQLQKKGSFHNLSMSQSRLFGKESFCDMGNSRQHIMGKKNQNSSDELDSPIKSRKASQNSIIMSTNNLNGGKSDLSSFDDHESDLKGVNLHELVMVKEAPSRIKLTGKIIVGVILSVVISTFFILLGIHLSDECAMNLFSNSKCVKTPKEIAEAGQEKNIVKINYKAQQVYSYKYQVQHEQKGMQQTQNDIKRRFLIDEDENTADGEFPKVEGLEDQGQINNYEIQFVCANVTETHFNFFLVINNLTQQSTGGVCTTKEGKDCNSFYDGYPSILKTLEPGAKGENRRMLEETIRVQGHHMTEEMEKMFEANKKNAVISRQYNKAVYNRLMKQKMEQRKLQSEGAAPAPADGGSSAQSIDDLQNGSNREKLNFKSQSDESIQQGKETGFEDDIEDPVDGDSSALGETLGKSSTDDGELKPDEELFHEIHDGKIAKELGLTKAQYMVSFIPIFYIQVSKKGTIDHIQRPVQVRDEFYMSLPQILSQFTPVLLKSVYDGEQGMEEKTPFGEVKPEFSQETDGDATKLKNKKSQNIVEESDARSSQQTKKTKTDNVVEGGVMKSSTAQSEMKIMAKPDEETEKINQEKGVPSNDLMGDMNIGQKAILELVNQQQAETNYLPDIQDMFSKMALVKQTYKEFLEDKAEVEKKMTEEDITQAHDEKDFKGQYEDENGNPIDEQEVRRVLLGRKKVFPTQYVALFKKNASGMKVESYLGLECFETQGITSSTTSRSTPGGSTSNKQKDTCYVWLELTIGTAQFQITPRKEFRANLKSVVKAVNWFRIRVLEGLTTFGLNVTTNFQELTQSVVTVIDDIGNYIDVRENQITRPVFIIKDTVNNVVEYTHGNFTEFIKEQTEIFSRLIKGPINRIEEGLKEKTERIFKVIQANNEVLIRSFNLQVQGLSDIIDATGEIKLSDLELIEKVGAEFQRLKKVYILNPLDNVMDIYTTSAVSTMKHFLQNFGTVFEDIKNFRDNRARGTEIAKNIMMNFFKLLMSHMVNQVVSRAKDQQEVNIMKSVTMIKETLDVAYKQMEEKIYALDQKARLYHPGPGEGLLVKTNKEFLKNMPIYNNKAFDVQRSIIDTASDTLLKDSSSILINHILSDLREAMESFVEFKENIQGTFTGAASDVKEAVTGIGSKITNQFKTTKNNFKAVFNKTREFLSEGVAALKVLIKGGNETVELTESQTLDIYSVIDDVIQIKTNAENGINDVKNVITKVKALPGKFQEFKQEIVTLFTDPFERIRTLEWKLDLPELEFFDPRELADLMTDSVKDNKVEMDESANKEVNQKGDGEVSNFEVSAESEGNLMSRFLNGDIFEKLTDLDFLFKEVFLKLVQKFEIKIGPNTLGTPFFKRLEYTFIIPTPIGINVNIGLYAQFKAYAYWGINIKGLGIEFYGGARATCSVGAKVSVGIPKILEIGVYFEGIIFDGALQVELEGGFKNQFYGRVAAKIYLEALKFKAGIFVQYITIEIRYKCLLERRQLSNEKQLKQPALFSENFDMDSNSPNTKYEIYQREGELEQPKINEKMRFLSQRKQQDNHKKEECAHGKAGSQQIRKLQEIANKLTRKLEKDGKTFIMYGKGRRNLCFRGFIKAVVKAVVEFFENLVKLCLPYPWIEFSEPKDLVPPLVTKPLISFEITLFEFSI